MLLFVRKEEWIILCLDIIFKNMFLPLYPNILNECVIIDCKEIKGPVILKPIVDQENLRTMLYMLIFLKK